uniref:beta-ketoacyl-[acyl-carrier-protein] synthase I n=1 Tax=Gambierdiscus polynesiensis TaxID=439318 RepID=A0A1S6K8H8_9DINO|nr:3-ketoacyl acyl carrier protein synthase II [Gambierdiscus polynesiensis]
MLMQATPAAQHGSLLPAPSSASATTTAPAMAKAWSGAGASPCGGAAASASAAAGTVAATAVGFGVATWRGPMRRLRATRAKVQRAAEGHKHRVVVTGLGLVSPFGTEPDEFYDKLCAGTSAVKTIDKFDTQGLPTRIAAQIDGFSAVGYVDRKSERRMDDVVKYTIVSGKRALEDAGLELGSEAFKALDKERCGVLIGSAMGGTSLQTSIENMDKLLKGKRLSPFFVPYTLVNVPGGLLAIDLGFKGPNYAVVTACATGNYCISAAAGHIERGECDVALAGGAEAAVTRAGIAGFNACKALSTRNDEPQRASRPWDKARDGFVMGEGAGVLCLESLEHAQRRSAPIYAEYIGGAYSCDAHHMTEPHPKGEGVARCIGLALKNAGVSAEDVGYLNCHGTSTPAGDMAEVRAIQRAFDGKTDGLVVNSTKSMVGHCLGAAAGVEAVVTIQALRHCKVHPTINLEDPEDGFDLRTPSEALELPRLEVAASNSFGFGGHNSCLLFKRFEG